AAVADGAAVVDVDDGEAATGPELLDGVQRRERRPGGTAVAVDDQRRALALGPFEVAVGRRGVEGVRLLARRRGGLDGLWLREVPGVDGVRAAAAKHRLLPGAQIEGDDGRLLAHRRADEGEAVVAEEPGR